MLESIKDKLAEIYFGLSPQAQNIMQAFSSALRPPRKLDLDDWSDANRILPEGTSAEYGKWRTSRFPFHREIMKCLSPSSPCKYVDVIKGSQLGFTELMINWMLYTIDHDPVPFLYIQKSLDDVNDFADQKLQKSIEDTTCVRDKVHTHRSAKGTNKKRMKTFPGGYIALGGANVASSLRSRSIAKLGLDEVDSYNKNIQGEGDPLLLAERRTSNFPNAKIYRVSTPGLEETSRIKPLTDLGDQRNYFVPCPHCNASADKSGTYFTIKWKNITYENNNPYTAKLVCVECGCLIDEHNKTWMLENGEWRAQNPSKPNQQPGDVDVQRASFIISALYSPIGFFSWGDAANMFIEANLAKDKEQLKVFVNTVLGETWSETGRGVSYEFVQQRQEVYSPGNEFDVPLGAYILVAGADVQDDRIECEVVALGMNGESWSIEYRVFTGDTEQDQVWNEFDLFLLKTYRHQTGVMMNIYGTAVDSGHRSKMVYAFCKAREFRRIFPVKGKAGWGQGNVRRPLKPHPEYGVWLFTVWVDEVKLTLYSRLRETKPGPQYCHFPYRPDMYNDNYFKMLTAEVLKTVRKKGQTVIEWYCPEGARNEALDCRVYALSVIDILQLDLNTIAANNLIMSNMQAQQRPKKKIVRRASTNPNL